MLANALLFWHIIVNEKTRNRLRACLGNQHQGLLLSSAYVISTLIG